MITVDIDHETSVRRAQWQVFEGFDIDEVEFREGGEEPLFLMCEFGGSAGLFREMFGPCLTSIVRDRRADNLLHEEPAPPARIEWAAPKLPRN